MLEYERDIYHKMLKQQNKKDEEKTMMVIGLILTLNIHLTVLIQKGRISLL